MEKKTMDAWVDEWFTRLRRESQGWSETERQTYRDRLLGLLSLLCEWYPHDHSLLNRAAMFMHQQGLLKDAGKIYKRLADLRNVQNVTESERETVLRLAPKIYTLADEPFELKDMVAVLHPSYPCIAYHLFWDNDWDFPDGYECCDHEIMWVGLDPGMSEITRIWSYFHGHILHTEEAVERARREGRKPSVFVQWGKHGSIIAGMEKREIPWNVEGETVTLSIRDILYRTFRYSSHGGRAGWHPVKKSWPSAYTGTFENYLDFSREVECRSILSRPYRIWKTEWTNAELFTHVLAYPFSPKPEWPDFSEGE